MFVVPYILVRNVFILVQLNVQFLMFLKSLLAQHVSDVTASIIRSTTVVFTAIDFWFLVCLFRATCIGIGPHRHCITVSFRHMCNCVRKGINWRVNVQFGPVVTTIHVDPSVVSLLMAQGVSCFYGFQVVFPIIITNKCTQIVIRFTIVFLKTLNLICFGPDWSIIREYINCYCMKQLRAILISLAQENELI
jgi:hypothetical protein